MEDLQRVVFAFALEQGTILFPALGLLLLGLAVFLLTRQGRFRWARRIAAGLCVALIVPCALAFHFTRSVNAALVRRVGDFSFRLVSDDSEHRLSDYAGKVVVLNFWATWCAPCLKELPDLEQLAERRQGEVVVLTVSDEPRDDLRAAVPAKSARVNGYFADTSPDDPIGKMAYQGRPTTLVIGHDGRVREVLVGAHTLASFEAALGHSR
jgi:thiol-disulfide isomerase/thioredoxin